MTLDFGRTLYRSLSAVAGALFVSTLLAPSAQSAVVAGHCVAGKAAFATSTATKITSGTTYVDIAEASVKFTQGGNAASCAMVQFSAEALAPQSFIELRAVLDGNAIAAPGGIVFQDGDTTSIASRDFTFLFAKITPGQHTIKMQMRSSNGHSVAVYFHTTVVLHP